MAARNPCAWLLNNNPHPPDVFRRALGAAISTPGVDNAGDLVCTFDTAVLVTVAAGGCIVPGTLQSDQGVYACYNDASVNLTVGTNSAFIRHDIVVAQVLDDQYSGGSHIWQLAVVPGTVANTDPTLPANSYALARLTVPATSGNYTVQDLRNTTVSTAGYFGSAGPPNNTTNTGAASFMGQHLGDVVTDVNGVRWFWNGSVWIPQNTGLASFRVYQNAAENSTTTIAAGVFNTTQWDGLGGFTSGTTYTIPAGWGGKWDINAKIEWTSASAGTNVIELYKNGSPLTVGSFASGASGTVTSVIGDMVSVVAGDTLQLWTVAVATTPWQFGQPYCYFGGNYVGQ